MQKAQEGTMIVGILLAVVILFLMSIYETFALVVMVICAVAAAIIGMVISRGWTLLIIPAAGLAWLAYQGTYLWYSPDFWPIATNIAVIVMVIAAIAFLCWLHERKPALAITIAVVLVVAACAAFGIYGAFYEMGRFGGAR